MLSLPSCPHTQMSRISSWSIIQICLRTPGSYEWSSLVPRMQGSQHSPTSCWDEKYAISLTAPPTHTHTHILFISSSIVLERSGTSLWDFFVPGRCFLSPRRCTPLAAKLWGSSQRRRPRWCVPATGQRGSLKGLPLLLDRKKMTFRLTSLRKEGLLFL